MDDFAQAENNELTSNQLFEQGLRFSFGLGGESERIHNLKAFDCLSRSHSKGHPFAGIFLAKLLVKANKLGKSHKITDLFQNIFLNIREVFFVFFFVFFRL